MKPIFELDLIHMIPDAVYEYCCCLLVYYYYIDRVRLEIFISSRRPMKEQPRIDSPDQISLEGTVKPF